jgi:hypothetical protein
VVPVLSGICMHTQTGKQWQKRWFVLDLATRTLTWYVDNREGKINAKGAMPLEDVARTLPPAGPEPAGAHSFVVATPRATMQLRASTPSAKRCWMALFAAVSALQK